MTVDEILYLSLFYQNKKNPKISYFVSFHTESIEQSYKMNVGHLIQWLFERLENIVGKGEKTGNQLLPKGFQQLSNFLLTSHSLVKRNSLTGF